jgi:hypothetical protein
MCWKNVGENLCADLIAWFVVILVSMGLWFYLDYRLFSRMRRFFGVDQQNQIKLYLSRHQDSETRTMNVVTEEEFRAAFELVHILGRQFGEKARSGSLMAWVLGLIGWPCEFPEFIPEISSDYSANALSGSSGLIAVGGPVRNKVTEYYLKKGTPYIQFDPCTERFSIQRDEQKAQVLDSSGKSAALNKMLVDGKVVFIALGFGEVETGAAVRYLANNWQRLEKNYGKSEFGIYLTVDNSGKLLSSRESSELE